MLITGRINSEGENAMKLPEYISKEEVQRVCRELGIRDWTALKEAAATTEEAAIILNEINTERMPVEIEEFRNGLDVELEHGIRFKDANVTNNHPVVTGMIVLAHLKESLYYYKLLDVAEAEGDLANAVASGNLDKIRKYYKKLAHARRTLSDVEAEV
jgi:hypothetical protein